MMDKNGPFYCEALFLKRDSDGKFFRGATFWKWSRSWRHAAVVDRAYWNELVIPKLPKTDTYGLWTLDEIMTLENIEHVRRKLLQSK